MCCPLWGMRLHRASSATSIDPTSGNEGSEVCAPLHVYPPWRLAADHPVEVGGWAAARLAWSMWGLSLASASLDLLLLALNLSYPNPEVEDVRVPGTVIPMIAWTAMTTACDDLP